MVGLVRFIGVLLALIGIGVFVKPDILRQMISFAKKPKRVYWSCGVKTLIGIIFLLAALQCKVPLVIAIFGILFASTIVICMMMKEKGMKAWIEFWEGRPDVVLRIWSLITLAIGALIIFSA